MVRKGKGRQKISMEKMKNESNLQVTFSKRRSGLFKKASELCILCGVEVAIIVFSPGQKVYSFGHPSVDHIMNNYFNNNTNFINQLRANPSFEAHHNPTLKELNMELTYVQNLLEMENARGQYLKNMKKDNHNAPYWWDVEDKSELTLEQLECLKGMMENLQIEVGKEQQNIIVESENNRGNISAYQRPPPPPNVLPFDAQSNDFFSPLPYVTTTPSTSDGAGPSGGIGPHAYHPGLF